jgi:hypothetical protein
MHSSVFLVSFVVQRLQQRGQQTSVWYPDSQVGLHYLCQIPQGPGLLPLVSQETLVPREIFTTLRTEVLPVVQPVAQTLHLR